jgi:hypothetical protein
MMMKLFSVALAVSIGIGILTASQKASAQVEKLPNLQATPAHSLSIVSNAETGNPELRLGATSWNSGTGPVELVAGLTNGNDKQEVYQRVYKAGGSYNDYLAGTFIWHPAHNHFHFERYAVYTLNPIAAPGASQRQAYKTSFCVMDTTKVNVTLPGAPKKSTYATCNADKQGMSVGWGDTYGAYLAGQSIDLTGLPDGVYELTVEFDPANQLHESSDSDNSACSLLDISVTNLTVQNVGACGSSGGTLSITKIEPTAIYAGTTIEVTVTGTNFYPGIAVGFENGSKPSPVASNINVLNSTTIKATVNVKGSGRGPDYVWDVRVGSAVLPDAFTVQ